MSYAPAVYSQKQNLIRFNDLKNCISSKNWNVSMFYERSGPELGDGLVVTKVDDNALVANSVLYGWTDENISHDYLRTLILNKEDNIIQKLLDDEVIGVCVLFVQENYQIEYDYTEEDVEELIEDMGEEYVEQLKVANTRYSASVNSGCGLLAGDFIEIVCDALVELTDGFFDDQ